MSVYAVFFESTVMVCEIDSVRLCAFTVCVCVCAQNVHEVLEYSDTYTYFLSV